MKNSIVKSCVVAGILFSTFLIIIACVWEPDSDDMYYRFFSPSVVTNKVYEPFHYSAHSFFLPGAWQQNSESLSLLDSVNLNEWDKNTGSVISRRELRELVYDYPVETINELLSHCKHQVAALPDSLQALDILKMPDKKRSIEILEYLQFAKLMEPVIAPRYNWDYTPTLQDTVKRNEELTRLLNRGKLLSKTSTDKALKERYSFQIIRLLFALQKYDTCIKKYKTEISKISLSPSIKFRFMGYVAGAFRAVNNLSMANYLYAKIYSACDAMKLTAFVSFSPNEESDWADCLKQAKTKNEKTAIWHLLGIKNDALRGIKEIYAIDPASEYLDVLLVRLINLAERKFLPERSYIDTNISSMSPKSGNIDKSELQICKRIADEHKSHSPALWELGFSYLSFAGHNYAVATEYLEKAKKNTEKNERIKEQIRILETVYAIEMAEVIGNSQENALLANLEWIYNKLPNNSAGNFDQYTTNKFFFDGIFDWMSRRLAERYMVQGDTVKAWLISGQYSTDRPEFSKTFRAVKIFLELPKHSAYEKFLIKIYPLTLNDMYDYLGVQAFLQGDMESAYQNFSLGEKSFKSQDTAAKSQSRISNWYDDGKQSCLKELPGDPFIIHINDCHDCDHSAPQEVKYTKLSFVKKMLDLQKVVKEKTPDAAMKCFALANGFYNATYFGNARSFYETKIKYYGGLFDGFQKNTLVTDCRRARYYYEMAASLSKDAEFRAQCTFMAAKCEQNMFFENFPADFKGDFRAGVYFAQLKNEFSSTKYFQEILKECGYFKTFVQTHNQKH
ncbi:MAG: hypothetical protein LWX56_12000 [Ignavibacteria bacterium]|nr:hypothetical protein [Ignavibacteria bacterium]